MKEIIEKCLSFKLLDAIQVKRGKEGEEEEGEKKKERRRRRRMKHHIIAYPYIVVNRLYTIILSAP